MKIKIVVCTIVMLLATSLSSLLVTNPSPSNGAIDVTLTPEHDVTINKLNMQHGVHVNNRTFISYMGSDPCIIQYNHTENSWLPSVQVGSASGGKAAPSMFINDSGYIWIFYDFHGGTNSIRTSKNPYYIGTSSSDWTADTWPGCSDAAYIHCINVGNDEVYIFYRCGSSNPRRWYYAYSTDGGETWDSDDQLIISTSDGGYGESYVFGMKYQDGKVHMVWHDSDHAYPDVSRNVYYNYFDTTDQHMYNITGADLGTAVDSAADMAASLAYQSPNDAIQMETNQGHIDVNSSGYPYIIFANGSSNSPELYSWDFLYWNGNEWSNPVNLTDDLVDSEGTTCDIKIYNDDNIKAYLTVPGVGHSAGDPGGDIKQYDWDGSVWSYNTTILHESVEGDALNMGYKIKDGLDEFAMMAVIYDYNEVDGNNNIYCWGNSGEFLWVEW